MTARVTAVQDDGPDLDWTTPGVYRCAPGVYRIPLPLPGDALKAVNVYAIEDGGNAVTLVDAGWALADARDLLVDALAALGAGLGDVRGFLVTHAHRDHYTQAVALRREFGTPIALGRGEEQALAGIRDAHRESAHVPRLRRAGAQELADAIARWRISAEELADWEPPDRWIDDGADVALTGRSLRAIHTPGHTRGHLVFADEPGGLLFAGDHVLPSITPSIGFEAVPPPSPLADFLTSLELLTTRPDAALLPAHGAVGMRVHERVDALLEHHGVRLDATLAAVREGRGTALEVAQVLPWTRRERRLDELDRMNAMLAVLETAAHLDVLVQRGALTVTDEGGTARYAV
ncbi:MBL fold metallo-hydrolase [Pseudonocardia sp.]|uniref:MBL fold metallo-hydrolase n=1 Tax=Pseudonocardia sp. TaxID=60912 RepID=UPI003D0F00EA